MFRVPRALSSRFSTLLTVRRESAAARRVSLRSESISPISIPLSYPFSSSSYSSSPSSPSSSSSPFPFNSRNPRESIHLHPAPFSIACSGFASTASSPKSSPWTTTWPDEEHIYVKVENKNIEMFTKEGLAQNSSDLLDLFEYICSRLEVESKGMYLVIVREDEELIKVVREITRSDDLALTEADEELILPDHVPALYMDTGFKVRFRTATQPYSITESMTTNLGDIFAILFKKNPSLSGNFIVSEATIGSKSCSVDHSRTLGEFLMSLEASDALSSLEFQLRETVQFTPVLPFSFPLPNDWLATILLEQTSPAASAPQTSPWTPTWPEHNIRFVLKDKVRKIPKDSLVVLPGENVTARLSAITLDHQVYSLYLVHILADGRITKVLREVSVESNFALTKADIPDDPHHFPAIFLDTCDFKVRIGNDGKFLLFHVSLKTTFEAITSRLLEKNPSLTGRFFLNYVSPSDGLRPINQLLTVGEFLISLEKSDRLSTLEFELRPSLNFSRFRSLEATLAFFEQLGQIIKGDLPHEASGTSQRSPKLPENT